MMKRKILIVALALGTVFGFGAGIHSVHRHHERHERVAQHLTEVCVDAALAAERGDGDRLAAPAPMHGPRYLERLERNVRHRCATEGRRHRR